MQPDIFRILDDKRFNRPLKGGDIRAVVAGAASGDWGDAEIAAFLMAVAIHGMDATETRTLTEAMLASGEEWNLDAEIPTLGDKHSTGGVGDKVSLVLSPLLAACGQPVVMLTGRGLGHTGGTADKLESIPGLDLALDRASCLRSLHDTGVAIGVPTATIAPADGRIYGLRDRTATIGSLPLITASILSKKLATGAAALVFDVKTGNGAFLAEQEEAERLAQMLVDTVRALGRKCGALVTDMSQPLGRWVGHAAEVREAYDCLDGNGPEDLMTVTYALSQRVASLAGSPLSDSDLDQAIASGKAREVFERWAASQGADPAWLARPTFPLAPIEAVIAAPRSGVLANVATRRIGELLARGGGGRLAPEAAIDMGVALHSEVKIGEPVQAGQPLARLYLRQDDPALVTAFGACYSVDEVALPIPVLRGAV